MRFEIEAPLEEKAGHSLVVLIVSINPAGQTAAHNKAGPTNKRHVCVPEARSVSLHFAITLQCCLKDIKKRRRGPRCGALVHYDVDEGGRSGLFKVNLQPLKTQSTNQAGSCCLSAFCAKEEPYGNRTEKRHIFLHIHLEKLNRGFKRNPKPV